MIDARQLTKKYGEKTAVDGLEFVVKPGTVTGFLGPNGAGKSTTMRMIVGLDAPTSGTVTVNGRHYAQHQAPLQEVGALLEAKSIHPGRSAHNHLRALALTHGIPRRRVDEVIELAGLGSAARKRAGAFSLGMGQRLRSTRSHGRGTPAGERGKAGTWAGPAGGADRSRGVLVAGRRPGVLPFDAQVVKVLADVAAQAAVGLELADRRTDAEKLALFADRDRIGRDLHDLAIQRLFATGMTLQSVLKITEKSAVRERVTTAVADLCPLFTVDASDALPLVGLCGRRMLKKKN